MKTNEVFQYLDKHCKFKLKSGKEIYGVAWKEKANSREQIYFSSYAERIGRTGKTRNNNRGDVLNIDEVVFAECLG